MSVYSERDQHIGGALVLIIFTLICFVVGCNQERTELQKSYEEQQKAEKFNKYVMDLPVGATNIKVLDNPSNWSRVWIKFTLDDKDILMMQEGRGSSSVVSMVVLR